jgi:serine O-acetyltransferase
MRIETLADLRSWIRADLDRYGRGYAGLLLHEPQTRWQVKLRVAEYVTNRHGRMLGLPLRWRVRAGARRLGYTIPFNVFGPGLRLAHYGTIVVSEEAGVGPGCTIHPGVTLGVGHGAAPQVGAGVYFGPGAKAFGDIVIGDGVRAGANCVITKSVEPGATVVGVPARALA